LAKVATACGCDNVVECQAEDTAATLQAALDSNQMTIIVAKCESGNIPVPVIEFDGPVIKHRFMEEVKRKNA
jgi:sulfopyruvate decarboxylase subunit beta